MLNEDYLFYFLNFKGINKYWWCKLIGCNTKCNVRSSVSYYSLIDYSCIK